MKEGADPRDANGVGGEPGRLSRRTFCRRACLSAAALTAVPVLKADVPVLEADAPAAGQLRQGSPQEMKIEGAELLMLGYAMTFRYPTERDLAILIRAHDGGYHAYTQNCTHMGCPVNFERTQGRLECPCHEGAYDLRTGAVVFGPPRRALTRIRLELRRRGEVWAVGGG